jgi:eukaryotic-like serine/threonine-protein kinase
MDGALAKLTDFGLAKDSTVSASTASNAVLGTIAYAAPEQLRDARSAGPSADVHGLAATLYHLATGKPPRDGSVVQITEIVGMVPRPANAVNPDVPLELSNLLGAGLAPDPRDRPTMSAFGASLARLR